ncbi:CLUMA_CG018670, isoform A [Clunio marinus]|uniref:CLUMA_CG018670, isoform A n=1 Tax=Clunio marinus TaxID=568069 RepID=A0A1J1IYG2_9DIPT|nr:CLUMA_CG018670, isoform A [Clunio marinus]
MRNAAELSQDCYRFESLTPESSKVDPDNVKDESNAATNFPNLQIVSRTSSASLRDGIEFRIVGDLKNPREIINRTSDFESVIVVLQQLKCDVDSECRPDTHVHESQQVETEVENISDEISEFVCDNEAQNHLSEKYRKMLKKLGPPWNWLYEFATMNCSEMSYNYIESLSFEVMKRSDESNDDIDEAKVGEIPSSMSEMSGISYSDCTLFECNEQISKNHKVLIDAICSISEASDNGDCNIKDTNSIGSFLDEQMSKQQLQPSDYERLRKFISKAEEQGLVFNDLNELYNFFIQESSRENINYEVEIREEDEEEEGEVENVIATTDATQVENKKVEREIKDENKHVTTIFNESGIELDGKTLDTKLSEQMILGLVDKLQFEENISDVASAISSSSQAETIRMNQNNQEGAQLWPQNGKKEENMQTSSTSSMSYLDSLTHQKKIQSKQVGKSKSASSIKRQPFVCKIPSLPGIGPSMNKERVEKILRFIFHRSFKQGGLVYPRNFSEDNCPNMMTE